MGPMQQAMNDAENILAQEPAYGTDVDQVKKELKKVDVSINEHFCLKKLLGLFFFLTKTIWKKIHLGTI